MTGGQVIYPDGCTEACWEYRKVGQVTYITRACGHMQEDERTADAFGEDPDTHIVDPDEAGA